MLLHENTAIHYSIQDAWEHLDNILEYIKTNFQPSESNSSLLKVKKNLIKNIEHAITTINKVNFALEKYKNNCIPEETANETTIKLNKLSEELLNRENKEKNHD